MSIDPYLKDIRLSSQQYRRNKNYCWEHYCHFANERSRKSGLQDSLSTNTREFEFEKCYRIVSHKYTLDPLSAKGSMRSTPGGRFNIGDIDVNKFPIFSALYIAETLGTAFKERYGLYQEEKKQGLTPQELAFSKNDSFFVVKGYISQVLDLRIPNILMDFFTLIRDIKLPKKLLQIARQLNIDPMFHVSTLNELMETILAPDWRKMPQIYDVPSNSQILGQIAYAAGIEAILYPSRMSETDYCLAIYPENFLNSTSFVDIMGEVAAETKNKRLDAQNYLNFI